MLIWKKNFWTTTDRFRGDFGSASDAPLAALVNVVLDLKAGDFEILPALLALYFCCLILSFSLLAVKFLIWFCFFWTLSLFFIASAWYFSICLCLYLFCFSAFVRGMSMLSNWMNHEIMLYNKIPEVSKNYFNKGGIKSLKISMSKRNIAQKKNTNITSSKKTQQTTRYWQFPFVLAAKWTVRKYNMWSPPYSFASIPNVMFLMRSKAEGSLFLPQLTSSRILQFGP